MHLQNKNVIMSNFLLASHILKNHDYVTKKGVDNIFPPCLLYFIINLNYYFIKNLFSY